MLRKTTRKKQRRLGASLLVLSFAFLGLGSSAIAGNTKVVQENAAPGGRIGLVFQIGTFGRASAGFIDLAFADPTPAQSLDYAAGAGEADRDWYATQTAAAVAPLDRAAAQTTEPRAISFLLVGAPAKWYRLKVAVMTGRVLAPALTIGINGRQGRFYLQTVHAYATLDFIFSGAFLHAGKNRITLQAVATAGRSSSEARFIYDAVELDQIGAGFSSMNKASARVEPTIFFHKVRGQAQELLDVVVRDDAPFESGSHVSLELGGKSFSQATSLTEDFGEELVGFAVPEFPIHTHARVVWVSGKKKHRYEQLVDPQKKWTLLVVPHNHLDIGFTDYRAKVAAIHSQDIDEALELLAKHPSFRFSLDGKWPLDQFLKTRGPELRHRVITAVEQQKLFIPADYANLLTGFPTAEALIRSLYPSANFSRAHGTPFNYATITDVPSYSWSYASILASAGVGQLLAGSDIIRAPVLPQGHLDEDSPMWWEGPDGKKILLWYSSGYGQLSALFGGPPTVTNGRVTLPPFLQPYTRSDYISDAVIVYGSQGENTHLFPEQADLVEQWNQIYSYPHLEYSGFHDALEHVAKQFGTSIPTVRGDGGPYWEDGIASDAFFVAMERRNEARAPSAEKLATIASLVDPLLAVDKEDCDRMWHNIVLMDEHTWDSRRNSVDPTTTQAVLQSATKEHYATQARVLLQALMQNSIASITNSAGAEPNSLIVFNALNWTRSGPVYVDLNNDDEIVDKSDGEVVPVEVLRCGNMFCHVRFTARDIPAIGYKLFQLRPTQKSGAQKRTAPGGSTITTVIENAYYRVTLDPADGAVRSIYDKQLRHELADPRSPYRFGQYLYVTGGDRVPNSILQYNPVYPQPRLDVHPSHGGSLISVFETPDGYTARMKSVDVNTPGVVTTIRLFDREKKIEFVEDVDKDITYKKEAAYFAFPFAMDHPRFRYEIQSGVVDPAKDTYPGAGHEWFSVQHWVSAEEDGVAATVMPLDTPLVTLGDINRGKWPAAFGVRRGTIFSYVMNNYWYTNYRAGQGGHFRFRYVLTSGPSTDPPALSRTGWEEATPLEADNVVPQERSFSRTPVQAENKASFLTAADDALLLEAWKPAEDGHGTILRFLDLGGTTRTVKVESPLLHLTEAWQTNAVEKNGRRLNLLGKSGFEFTVHPHEIVTIRAIAR